jgi:hypothetical protein
VEEVMSTNHEDASAMFSQFKFHARLATRCLGLSIKYAIKNQSSTATAAFNRHTAGARNFLRSHASRIYANRRQLGTRFALTAGWSFGITQSFVTFAMAHGYL